MKKLSKEQSTRPPKGLKYVEDEWLIVNGLDVGEIEEFLEKRM